MLLYAADTMDNILQSLSLVNTDTYSGYSEVNKLRYEWLSHREKYRDVDASRVRFVTVATHRCTELDVFLYFANISGINVEVSSMLHFRPCKLH
jgi:hypothetical protein